MPDEGQPSYEQRVVVENGRVVVLDLKPDSKEHRVSLDSVLGFVRLLAILASGCWVLFQFVTFQREANKLSLRQQELVTQQAELTLRAQQAAEKANLAQAMLAAQQAEFTLRTQESQKELRERELEYSVQSKRLENEANQLAINSKTTYRTTRSSHLTAREIGNGQFEVDFVPGIKNTSDAAFEVSLVLVDVYIGKIDLENPPTNSSLFPSRESDVVQEGQDYGIAAPMFYPPPRWGSKGGTGGAIRWTLIGTVASVYTDAIGHFEQSGLEQIVKGEIDKNNMLLDGPGTGTWKPGESVEFEPKFLVRGKPTDYIGLAVSMCMNRAHKDEDLWWFSDYESIKDLIGQTPATK